MPEMSKRDIVRAMGCAFFRSEYAAWQGHRYATMYHAKFGDTFLDQLDGVEKGPDGRIRLIPDPAIDHEMAKTGAKAAGFFLAERLIGRGLDLDEVRRLVRGKVRVLSSAWGGSDFDKAVKRKAYSRGVDMAIRET